MSPKSHARATEKLGGGDVPPPAESDEPISLALAAEEGAVQRYVDRGASGNQ